MNTLDLTDFQFDAVNDAAKYLTQPVYSGKLTAELSDELILPDYIADAKKIIGVFAEIRGAEDEAADGKLQCTGEVDYTALIQTEENAYKSVSLTVPYEKSVEYAECSDPIPAVFTSLTGVQCRLLSPRKLSFRSKAECEARVYGRVPVEPKIGGAKSGEDEFHIERDLLSIETMNLKVYAAQRASFSEDIEIDTSAPAVSDILYCGVEVYTSELRPAQDKIQLNAEAEVTAIYTDDGGELRSASKRLPLTFTVEAADSDAIPLISVCGVRYTVENNGYGERRIIELDFNADVRLLCAENKSTEVIRDCYSTAAECTAGYFDAGLYTIRRMINTSFSYDARISRSELTLPENPRPVSTFADMKISEAVYDAQRGRATLSGEADIHMLVAGEGGAVEIAYSSPFKYECDCGEVCGEFGCFALVKATNIRGRIDGGGVYCDLEAAVTMTITDKKSERIVGEIRLGEAKKSDETRPGVLLYYPSRGERLWEIAKRYNTTRQAVTAANNLTGDAINGERVIMIPRKGEKAKEPVYTKII